MSNMIPMLRLRHLALTLALALLPLGVELPVLAVAPPPFAISHVQTVGTDLYPTSSGQVSLSISVTAGNYMICGYYSGENESTISDGANTFVKMVNEATGTPRYLTIWTVKSLASTASLTVTVTNVGPNNFAAANLHCSEYSGLDSTSDGDKTAAGTAFSTSVATASTATLSQADELVWGMCGHSNAAATTEGSGYTERNDRAGASSGISSNVADKTVSATTAVSYDCSWSGSTSAMAAVLTLKAASSGTSFIPGIINAPVRGGGRAR